MKKILLLSVLIITGCVSNVETIDHEEQEVLLDYSRILKTLTEHIRF